METSGSTPTATPVAAPTATAVTPAHVSILTEIETTAEKWGGDIETEFKALVAKLRSVL